MDCLFSLLMRRRVVPRFLTRASRMRTAPLGKRRPSKGPRFGVLSVVDVGIGAVSEPDSGFRFAGDSCPVRAMGARSSNSCSAGLECRSNGPWGMCGYNTPDTVRGPERCPVVTRGESTMCQGEGGPSPAEEGIEFTVEGGPTTFDRCGCQG
jgi:hypothetical protein